MGEEGRPLPNCIWAKQTTLPTYYDLLGVEKSLWSAANRAEIQTKIAEGYASAQRGELIGPDEVRAKLAEVKRARSKR
jgi:hypothetical protein